MVRATKEQIAETFSLTHFRNCPVPLHPDDEALQARVEVYERQRSDLRLNDEGTALTTPKITVVHCCQCGAMNHIEEL